MKINILFKKFINLGALVALCTLFLATPAIAADDIFTAGTSLVKDTASFIKTISHFAVVIGVGTGALMKKFSMGDPQKIATGGKIIGGSIVGWGLINGLDLILNLLKNYM